MNVVGILGSPIKRGTNHLLEKTLSSLNEKGIETELLHLKDFDIEFCRGCNKCLREAVCVIDDDIEKLGKILIEADGIVMASPSYQKMLKENSL